MFPARALCGTLSRQLTRQFLELWLRNLIPHWQRSLGCIQLCGSCLWSGRAPAVCSNIFIDGCVFCHRPCNGQKPARNLHSLHRRLQPSRVCAHFGAGFCGRSAFSYRRCSCRMEQTVESRSNSEDEIEDLVARLAGTLGRISLPRAVASKLNVLSSWFCQEEPRTIVHAQIVGGRWVRAFQFRQEPSSILANLWKWIGPEKLRPRRRLLPESMIDDVLLAVFVFACVCGRSTRKDQPACSGLRCLGVTITNIFVNGTRANSVARTPGGHPKIQRIGGFN